MTFDELAKEYADKIKAAASAKTLMSKTAADIRRVKASLASTASNAIVDVVLTLAEIDADLSRHSVNQQPIDEGSKNEVIRRTGVELGLDNPQELIRLIKGSSNQSYLSLVTQISALIQQVRK